MTNGAPVWTIGGKRRSITNGAPLKQLVGRESEGREENPWGLNLKAKHKGEASSST